MIEHDKAVVKHIERQSLDHSLLILDANPNQGRRTPRLYFDKKWVHRPGIEDVVKRAWDTECEGSAMFKVAAKIKKCKSELLQWSRQQQGNAAKVIQRIKGEMDRMKEEGGQRDWES